MNTMRNKLFPAITNVIRRDHTQVLASFHQYQMDCDAKAKETLAAAACLALEIHTQLEDEIFYPAMRAAAADGSALDKSGAEHDSIRQSIAKLRGMRASEPGYDQAFMDLMKAVMHHFADEETVLLPEAELKLKDSLGELGGQMVKRSLQLAAPHAGEIALRTIRARPGKSILLAAGALAAGTYVVRRSLARHHA